MPIFVDKENPVWFAMSAPYQKELEARDLLAKNAIESFIPMRYCMVATAGSKKERRLVPAIHNLIFARTTRRLIQKVKTGYPYLQYKIRREDGQNIPIVVPERQMTQFISVCNTYNDDLIYLKPEEVNLAKGTPVRIIGGTFDGMEGTFVKVKGARRKRVVVSLPGLAAVATAEIATDYIQVIRPEEEQK